MLHLLVLIIGNILKKRLKNIERFNAVREESGVELCKKYFRKDAVLDPTMLLTADEYRNLLQKENF